jgi:hypothetical protein
VYRFHVSVVVFRTVRNRLWLEGPGPGMAGITGNQTSVQAAQMEQLTATCEGAEAEAVMFWDSDEIGAVCRG